ncbi:hypothetical protein A1O1_00788 [Capronia coronata CBS 617.96]|uniref:N-acetyltransferase domain-containing protein n=1 Tax=Capronia coronata CBS 617.96 TaxID=1182541 RepID=W9Z266_9EURO|nr:uncharacterized protein A1O1_00788 [Capronia coronata CBS 617.96]EXJ95666.1 hypothetical protein A1O1_00788 [Capronia coronata CBS 617.96]
MSHSVPVSSATLPSSPGSSSPTTEVERLRLETTPLLTIASQSTGATTTAATQTPQSTLRRARFSDLAPAAHTCTLAFWDEALFGNVIHPRRATYPGDVNKYWYRRFVVDWWDWSHVFLVTTETVPVNDEGDNDEDGPASGSKENVPDDEDEAVSTRAYQTNTSRKGGSPQPLFTSEHLAKKKRKDAEVITGFAHWSRIAPSWRENYQAGWGLRWWDPRRLLKPIASMLVNLWALLSPNRAASPENEDVLERSYNFLDHVWTGERAESWYLESLAVHPSFQGRGLGRALVAWGLEQACEEGISTSVIAADGKEPFYQKCGFDVGPVARSGEGQGNPLREVAGGLAFFRDKAGVRIEAREPGPWMEGFGVFDWEEWQRKTFGGERVEKK